MSRRHFMIVLAGILPAAGCVQKMNVEPKYRPMAESGFFDDGASARPQVQGTVARDGLRENTFLYEGRTETGWADGLPFPVTADVLERGRERYNIFCSPCHGRLGDGNGMIVQRGFRGPVSFHQARFRNYPTGYFFDVITNGRGAMYPYGYRVPPEDRWAIIAYIRALQLSEHAGEADVPPDQLQKLEGAPR